MNQTKNTKCSFLSCVSDAGRTKMPRYNRVHLVCRVEHLIFSLWKTLFPILSIISFVIFLMIQSVMSIRLKFRSIYTTVFTPVPNFMPSSLGTPGLVLWKEWLVRKLFSTRSSRFGNESPQIHFKKFSHRLETIMKLIMNSRWKDMKDIAQLNVQLPLTLITLYSCYINLPQVYPCPSFSYSILGHSYSKAFLACLPSGMRSLGTVNIKPLLSGVSSRRCVFPRCRTSLHYQSRLFFEPVFIILHLGMT